MTSPWRHPPGTLRALKATFGKQYVICRRCERYTPMQVEAKDLDRRYEPCPFRCSRCRRRGEIVFDVPEGFAPIEQPASAAGKATP